MQVPASADHDPSTPSILVLNAGSSSLKFAVFRPRLSPAPVVRGAVDRSAHGQHLIARDGNANTLIDRHLPNDEDGASALRSILDFTNDVVAPDTIAAVGHRIVHGGLEHVAPALVTPALLASLEALTPLAPLHMPLSLMPIRAIAAAHPDMAQVACFDTAFHRTMPLEARSFALPRAIQAAGVHRYGFHGLSFEFVAGRLAELAPGVARKRVVVAHLGSGASLCALRDGASVATTMGFTPLDGLVMSTRCGSLDPGVMLYLLAQGRSRDEIEEMLYHHSGLLGVSGISGDLRVLSASDHRHAKEAIALFVHRLVCEMGAMAAALDGIDAIVFTAGIGQHDAALRASVCQRLSWMGIGLDEAANAAHAIRVSAPQSPVEVFVIPTNEEAVIARHTDQVMTSI